MFPEHQEFKEAAHIGEELFNDNSYEIERNCQSIQRGMERKLFTMEAGLKVYGVTMEQYEQYLGKDMTNLLSSYISTNKTIVNGPSFIHVISYMVKHFSEPKPEYDNFNSVIKALNKFTKEVEEKYAHQEG